MAPMSGQDQQTSNLPVAGAAGDSPIIVSVSAITKDFPGLRALDRVSMEVRSGEILALLGQNGSGKSTLVKILAGIYAADEGEVRIRRDRAGPGEVLHFIHQDLGLIDSLSTVENLAVGRTRTGSLRPLRHRLEQEHARALVARFGADFDVRKPLATVTPAQRSIVAIARAMDGWSDPRGVLVLDEPTAALHGKEVGVLFTAVREAARAGAGIIFISHRLGEVIDLADRVVVLRDGRVVADTPTAGLSADALASLITGRKMVPERPRSDALIADSTTSALSVRDLTGTSVRAFALDIWPGEVVGVGGNLGSGREEVAGLIFGALAPETGTVRIGGRPLRGSSPRESVRAGLALVPADRRAHGAVMTHDVVENLTLPELRSISLGGIHLSRRKELAEATAWAERVGVAPNLPRRPLRLFSGGNQQKVVIGRWLRVRPSVLLVEEPTQGVDVGSSESIRALIIEAARRGAAVLVTSSDNTDLIRMCSRVLVLRDGVLTAELRGNRLTDHRLTEECLGVSPRQLVAASAEDLESSDG